MTNANWAQKKFLSKLHERWSDHFNNSVAVKLRRGNKKTIYMFNNRYFLFVVRYFLLLIAFYLFLIACYFLLVTFTRYNKMIQSWERKKLLLVTDFRGAHGDMWSIITIQRCIWNLCQKSEMKLFTKKVQAINYFWI